MRKRPSGARDVPAALREAAAANFPLDTTLSERARQEFDAQPELADAGFAAALDEYRDVRAWLEATTANDAHDLFLVGSELPSLDALVRAHRQTPALDAYVAARSRGRERTAGRGPARRGRPALCRMRVLRQNRAVRSAAACAFIALYTLIVGPPVLVLAAIIGSQRLIIEAGLAGTRVALGLAGIRWVRRGTPPAPASRGTVYCVNHSSYLDLVAFVALYPVCPGLRVIYKAELGRVPILGRVFSMAGAIPIQRAQHDAAVEALDHGVEALRVGTSMLAAPEGTRSRDGSLALFKKGLFVMAIQAGAPVVPVAIHGAREALPRGEWRIRPGVVTVTIGDAIETSGLGYDDRALVADTVRDRLAQLLATQR